MITKEKLLQNFISSSDGWTWKKYRNKAEMKEHKKTTLHLQNYIAHVG